MNSVILAGRLTGDPVLSYTRDPEIPYSSAGTAVARFKVAVERRHKREGEPTEDFVPCIAVGTLAKHIAENYSTGSEIELCGRIQVGSYQTTYGTTVHSMDIVAETVGFGEAKSDKEGQA